MVYRGINRELVVEVYHKKEILLKLQICEAFYLVSS